MEEYIDILDDKGEKTGKSLTYNETHRTGLIHRTVHIWFLNSQNQLLLQKRSMKKRAYPGMWDISVGGHISAGQTSLEAAQRETEEELGKKLSGGSFNFLFTLKQPRITHRVDFIDDEFNDVYLVHYDGPESGFVFEKDEIDGVKWVGIETFKNWLSGHGEQLVPHPEEYRLLLEKIGSKKVLKS